MFIVTRLYLILGAIALLGVFSTLWYFHHLGIIHEREKQRAADVAAFQISIAKADAVARDLESKLAQMQVEKEQLTKELENETRRNPVYRNCRVPIDGVRLLQRAITGTPTR